MSPEGYLVELEHRHADLEKELSQERHRSRYNDLELAGIRRKKLRIKDEMARVRARHPALTLAQR